MRRRSRRGGRISGCCWTLAETGAADCQVLNIYFHQSPNAELLAKNFVLVDVNIGHMDANLELAHRYGVPVTRGVPALAVVDDHGQGDLCADE